jgi:hypothetical protein
MAAQVQRRNVEHQPTVAFEPEAFDCDVHQVR